LQIGHGFGLPHTDENFFNKDLFNCMDYTNNPENNMQPAEPNYKFLSQLYGTVDGSPVPTDDTTAVEANASANATTAEPEPAAESDKRDWKDIFGLGGKRRALTVNIKSLPPSVALALGDIDQMVDNGLFGSENGAWRKLHESPHGHAHEMDLGHGFTVQIHVLR
jgi:hypothetical protein